MDACRFAVRMRAAIPTTVVEPASQLLWADLLVFADLHWPTTTGTRRTITGDYDVLHDDFSPGRANDSRTPRSASIASGSVSRGGRRSEASVVLATRRAFSQLMTSARR